MTDAEQIGTFTDALFRYASEGCFVSLRAFDDRHKGKPPFAIEPVQINGAGLQPVTDRAAMLAARCAKADQAIVFCPPVATFKTGDNAQAENVAEGVALSVECDSMPGAARAKLESLLGAATVVVASGGEWTDPETGEVQTKLHLHWRLTEPTQTPGDHAKLRRARELATALVGGDATNVPLVHPIRWPGSLHRKGEPRLARIVTLNEGAEIDLGDALESLQDAAGAPPLSARAASTSEPHNGAQGARIDTGQQGKSADDYARLLRGMKTDGEKHASVRDVAASLAAQGASKRFVEGFIKENCPVYDQNVQASIDSAFQKYAEPAPAPTGDPVDLWGSFDPPELPQGLLPPVIEDFARVNGEQMGADPAGLAMAALATCAAAIPDAVRIKVKKHDDWTESARLWVALMGPPSAKKSPIISAATGALCRLDVELMRGWQKRVAAYDALSADEKKGKQRPPQTRLRIEDATVEAAQEVMEGSPWGILLLNDELSGFFGQMDKYNGGKGAQADRAFWLRSYNGGQYALNRVGRGVVIIDNLSVSMLGGIQPEPLRKIAGDSIDDGLLQRLLPIMLRTATMGRDEPMPPVNSQYRALIEGLRNLTPPGWMEQDVLRFDNGAQAIRRELEARHLDLQSLETINRKLASSIGKYDGLFARLCVIWHCVEHIQDTQLCDAPAFDGAGLPATVTEATAQRVADFLHRFLLAHAVAFYSGVLGLSDDHDRLTAIAGYILAHKLERITNRDVQRGDKTMRGLREHEIRPLLEQLAALGWLEQVPGPRPSSPPQWIVNPAVHRRFADRADAERTRRDHARSALSGLLGAEA